MKAKPRAVIGIIGGLGPYAHIALESRLLEEARQAVGASEDQDYPQWILSSIPQTPDRTVALHTGNRGPVAWLLRSLRRLTGPDRADFVILACNTAHVFLEELRQECSVEILDMIGQTVIEASRMCPNGPVGLLATDGTIDSRLYHASLDKAGITAVSPRELPDGAELQRRVMDAVYGHSGAGGIKGLGAQDLFRCELEYVAEALIEAAGVNCIISGCTEISAVLPTTIRGVPVLDPLRVVARIAVVKAYGLNGP